MDRESAWEFLRRNPAMPFEELVSRGLDGEYEQVRRYLKEHPDPAFIPLLLAAAGDGGGNDEYHYLMGILDAFPPPEVVPHLVEALWNGGPGLRRWAAEISPRFPAAELVDPLASLLELDDPAARTAAVEAFRQLRYSLPQTEAIDAILERALPRENDPEVRRLLEGLTLEPWDRVRRSPSLVVAAPDWVRAVLKLPLQSVHRLPVSLRFAGLSRPSIEYVRHTESYLDFLRGQIQLQARGPEWTDLLRRRLAAFESHVGELLLSLRLYHNQAYFHADLLVPELNLLHCESPLASW